MAEKKEMESGKDDVVSLQLHAPPGWTKKCRRKGGLLRKNDIVFIAPTGEEINSKRQLEQYLKANPGGPVASEFNWGSGETPRRSVRISEKVKALLAPESTESPRKRRRKPLASKKDNEEEPETAPEGTETKDVHMEESDKGNVEGEARKVAVKGNDENENKDKPQDADRKTESIARETKPGEDGNVSTNIKECKENATSEVKLQQTMDEAEEGRVSDQHDRPGISIITQELKNEVVGEDKAKHERNISESGGAIMEKESINCNEVQNITDIN